MSSGLTSTNAGNAVSQQKLASQLPRGTRLNQSGTHIELKGARNFSARPVSIAANEMHEDIVLRGMRSDGLSTKLGVKNSKDIIAKLISQLFRNDVRHDIVMDHFSSKRQKSNCAKNIYSTLASDEIKMMREELFPTRIDMHIKTSIAETFRNDDLKLPNAIDVLQKIQLLFSNLDAQSEILCHHNFQTRGFFADMIVLTIGFITQLLIDASTYEQSEVLQATHNLELDVQRADENAAEILLSVGESAMTSTPRSVSSQSRATETRPRKSAPLSENSKQEEKEWTAVELDDGHGPTKRWLVQTSKGAGGTIDAAKLVEMINNQEAVLLEDAQIQQVQFVTSSLDRDAERKTEQQATSQSYLLKCNKTPITTLEITIPSGHQDDDHNDNAPTRKKPKVATVT